MPTKKKTKSSKKLTLKNRIALIKTRISRSALGSEDREAARGQDNVAEEDDGLAVGMTNSTRRKKFRTYNKSRCFEDVVLERLDNPPILLKPKKMEYSSTLEFHHLIGDTFKNDNERQADRLERLKHLRTILTPQYLKKAEGLFDSNFQKETNGECDKKRLTSPIEQPENSAARAYNRLFPNEVLGRAFLPHVSQSVKLRSSLEKMPAQIWQEKPKAMSDWDDIDGDEFGQLKRKRLESLDRVSNSKPLAGGLPTTGPIPKFLGVCRIQPKQPLLLGNPSRGVSPRLGKGFLYQHTQTERSLLLDAVRDCDATDLSNVDDDNNDLSESSDSDYEYDRSDEERSGTENSVGLETNREEFDAYSRACILFGVTPRLAAVSNRMDRFVQLDECVIETNELEAVLHSFQVGKPIELLSLVNAGLTTIHVGLIGLQAVNSLANSLKLLDLSNNPGIGKEISPNAVHDVAWLARLHCLTELRLSSCSLGDGYISSVLSALGAISNNTLKYLDLSRNWFGKNSADVLSTMLRNPEQKLEILDLSWNGIRGHSAAKIGDAVSKNQSLKRFLGSWNHFGGEDESDVWGFALEKNPSIEEVDLRHNGFNDRNLFVILECLRHSPRMQVANLAGNPARSQHGGLSFPFVREKADAPFIPFPKIDEDPMTNHFVFNDSKAPRHVVLDVTNPFSLTILRHMYRIACNKGPNNQVIRNFRNVWYLERATENNLRAVTSANSGSFYSHRRMQHQQQLQQLLVQRKRLVIAENGTWEIPKKGVIWLTFSFVEAESLFNLRGYRQIPAIPHYTVHWGRDYARLSTCAAVLISEAQKTFALPGSVHSNVMELVDNSIESVKIILSKALGTDSITRKEIVSLLLLEADGGEQINPIFLSSVRMNLAEEMNRDAKRSIATLLYFSLYNPTGHYKLDLTIPVDRAIFRLLFELMLTEQMLRQSYFAPDTSQMSAYLNIRNLMMDDTPIGNEWKDGKAPQSWGAIPEDWMLRTVSFDYVATWRPLPLEAVSDPASAEELKFIASAETSPFSTESARILLLRQAAGRFNKLITCAQCISIVACFKEPICRVEAIVALHSRIADLSNFWETVMSASIFTKDEIQNAIYRLGILNVWNSSRPDGFYALDMANRDDRWMISSLCLLDTNETVLESCLKRFLYNNQMVTSKPQTWIREAPHHGFVQVHYRPQEVQGLRIDRKLRKSLTQSCLMWQAVLANNVTETFNVVMKLYRERYPVAAAIDEAVHRASKGDRKRWEEEEEDEDEEEEEEEGVTTTEETGEGGLPTAAVPELMLSPISVAASTPQPSARQQQQQNKDPQEGEREGSPSADIDVWLQRLEAITSPNRSPEKEFTPMKPHPPPQKMTPKRSSNKAKSRFVKQQYPAFALSKKPGEGLRPGAKLFMKLGIWQGLAAEPLAVSMQRATQTKQQQR